MDQVEDCIDYDEMYAEANFHEETVDYEHT
jgi:hypothetical protein